MSARDGTGAGRGRLTSTRAKIMTTVLVLVASTLPVEFAADAGGAIAGSGAVGARAAVSAPVNYARYFLSVDHFNSPATQASRWPLLIGQSDQYGAARQIKAAAPSAVTTVFYANPLFLRQTDPDGITTAVRNADAFARHPEWFLLDSAGRRIPAKNFANKDYAADIGSKTYQQAAASFLLGKINTEGWDGVFLDDTNPTPAFTFTPRPAKFPTDASWQQAESAFVGAVCGAIKAVGKRCYLNLGELNSAWAQSVARRSTGPMTEFFVGLNPAVSGGPSVATIENGFWLEQLTWAAWAETNTAQQIVHASTTNADVTTYALASYLLVSTGKGAFAANRDYGSAGEGRTYPQSFTDARKLGAATSGYVEDASGIFYRTFTNGNVVVNPHETARTFRGVKYKATSGTISLY